MSDKTASPAVQRTVGFLRRFVKPRVERLAPTLRLLQSLIERLSPARRAPFAPDIPGDWTPSEGAPAATLYYLHGGAFLVGSPRVFRYASRRFAQAGFDVFTPAYRLAPEHVFPAALEDAVAAYKALAAARPGPIVVAGDSAGGGLAVSLMARLRDDGFRLPAAAALFSPWTDLAATGASARENEEKDAFFTRRAILSGARAALGKASARNPLASPLFADLSGLPPLVVHVGADEVLRDDSTRLVERARAAGVEAQIEIWPGVPHAWQLMSFLPEAEESRGKAIAFLKEKARRSV
ncbi:alpha/beta hydrolase [Methylocystis sp. WRRC1]|uniref:alpha/beta hydrolase n=1 Tax=Methylocystis sp. WRRC1 TaxID=1732014 RepID=UPI001D14F08E|nr:alpha/beta hydrolase [Methylocystis sp. WRRC1]MCC3245640.1 alpha/beta hydrolase [Methylocystis sp. WRRC1]